MLKEIISGKEYDSVLKGMDFASDKEKYLNKLMLGIKDKKKFLNDLIKKEEFGPHKSDIRAMLIEIIKKQGLVKTNGGEERKHFLVFDSVMENLEPVYFWVLDFMSDPYQGRGLNVSKTGDEFEAAVGGGYFADMGARASRMQEQAIKMMGTINTLVRSIINLIYDLKEFEIRLQEYENLNSDKKEERESGKLSLKQIWMDNVDVKRGRGSINMMAAQLQFVTLRDAFMAIDTLEDIAKADLNDRVKRILTARLGEYLEWEPRSGKELLQRYKVEKAYLKSQVSSLKLYAQWTKPYLKAAQKLKMKDFSSPHMAKAFENILMELTLFGKKEVTPSSIFPESRRWEGVELPNKYYACTEVKFFYRTAPHIARTQQGGTYYTHVGRIEMEFTPYIFSEEDLEILNENETLEGMDLIEDMVDVPLKELREDLEYYLKEDRVRGVEEKKKEKIKLTSPFGALASSFKPITAPFKALGKVPRSFSNADSFIISEIKKKAKGNAKVDCMILYDVYKKAHAMLSW